MEFAVGQVKLLRSLWHQHLALPAYRRYSRFVRLMKVLLPSLAAVLLVLVVIWPRLAMHDDRFSIGFAKLSPEAVQTLSMINARYFGVDQNNHPYTVTADVATQEDSQTGIIDLQAPKADFTSKDGATVMVDADLGYFHQKEQFLDLYGHVDLYHENGYEMHTDEAHVDLKTDSAHGERPVQGQGPQGHLEGAGFVLTDKGGDITVTGKSTLVLRGASAAQGSGGADRKKAGP